MSKKAKQLDCEIASVLTRSGRNQDTSHQLGPHLSWKGKTIPIDPIPRTIKSFELKREYVIRNQGRLYTIVFDTQRGENIAHPAEIEGASTRRAAHATKKHPSTKSVPATKGHDKTSDKISIDQLAALLDLPAWERIDELNQQHYWEMAKDAPDDDARMEAEQEEQTAVYNRWYDAVEQTAEKLLDEHDLALLAMKHTRKLHKNYRPHMLKIIPAKTWNHAANKIRATINGVGALHFSSLPEFLSSGPYTARQAVLTHLPYIKRQPQLYGGLGAKQLYDQAWG